MPGPEAVQLTGMDAVDAREAFDAALKAASSIKRTAYLPLRPEVLGGASVSDPRARWAASASIRGTAASHARAIFVEKVRAAAPASTSRISIRCSMPAIHQEPARNRAHSRIDAHRRPGDDGGDANRRSRGCASTNRGDGDYIFKADNATARRTSRSWPPEERHYPHYHSAQTQMKDGDLVLFDYAPDYNTTRSDVTRSFPQRQVHAPISASCTHLRQALQGADDVDQAERGARWRSP